MSNLLKETREKAGLSQVKLAEMANVSRPTIIKIEAGEENEVKVSTLIRLAAALGQDPKDIFLR